MSFKEQIIPYINAFPNNISVVFNPPAGADNEPESRRDDRDTAHVKVSDSDNPKTDLPVEEFQNLWKFDDSDLPPDLLPYIGTLVSSLKNEEIAELCCQITHGLPKALSKVMNGLSVKVNIADSDSPEDSPRDSLTGILLKVLSDKQCCSSDSQVAPLKVNRHKLSVVVEVHKLDDDKFQPNIDSELEKKMLIGSVPVLKYHYSTENFSVEVEPKDWINRDVKMQKLSEILFDDTINDVQALVALAIVLKCYPESWRQKFFWDAWLAITMQLCLSGGFRGKLTFPCVWMKQAFDVERLVSPERVQHLLFGKDPVSKTEWYGRDRLCKATGVAFYGIGNDNASIEGMKTNYGLDCRDENPIKYCKEGLIIVNLIRCIGENDRAMKDNSCRGVWMAYTLKLIHHFSGNSKPVIVLGTATSAFPRLYVPSVCTGDFVVVPHPSVDDIEVTEDVEKVRQYLDQYKP